jgi:hypothetical protein
MTTKTRKNMALGASRKFEKAAAHALLMEQHAAHKAAQAKRLADEQAAHEAAVKAYNRYWSAWLRGGRKGPKPVKPMGM